MSSFFQSWQRKLGCTTLGLACVMTAVWIASLSNSQFINHLILDGIPWKNGDLRLFTDGNSISLVRCEEFTAPQSWDSVVTDSVDGNGGRESEKQVREDGDQATNAAASGQTVLTVPAIMRTINLTSIVDIPYWSILTPLILVSAYLLLVKTGSKPIESPSGHPADVASKSH